MPRLTPSAGTSARLVLLLCALSIVFEGYDMVAYGVTLPAMLEDPSWNLSTEYAGVVGAMPSSACSSGRSPSVRSPTSSGVAGS